jgi:hypothetical protein
LWLVLWQANANTGKAAAGFFSGRPNQFYARAVFRDLFRFDTRSGSATPTRLDPSPRFN